MVFLSNGCDVDERPGCAGLGDDQFIRCLFQQNSKRSVYRKSAPTVNSGKAMRRFDVVPCEGHHLRWAVDETSGQ